MVDKSYKEGFAYHYSESFEDAKVENGLYFGTSKVFTVAAPLGVTNFLLQIGDKYCHGVFSFDANTLMMMEVFMGPTTSSMGTPVPSNNFKTYSTNTPLTQLYIDPTVTSDGNKIIENVALGSGGRSAVGASASDLRKFILAPNTSYLIRFTALPTSNQTPVDNLYRGSLSFNFYENIEG